MDGYINWSLFLLTGFFPVDFVVYEFSRFVANPYRFRHYLEAEIIGFKEIKQKFIDFFIDAAVFMAKLIQGKRVFLAWRLF